MFSHPFFMLEPIFDTDVEQAKTFPGTAPRFVSLARFAHDMLGWFALQPALTSVKLTSVAHPEIEQDPVSVRVRHHFNLSAINGTVPDPEEYALEHLPMQLMGDGVFQVYRDDELVQQALALSPEDAPTYQELVYALALRVNAAFSNFEVTHDVGLRSAS